MRIQCGSRVLELDTPRVMGILNVTPDSFYDGGKNYNKGALHIDSALRRAEAMVSEGATIIDVGGESTRPGASPVSLAEESDRVLPVVESLHQRLDVVLSVDTSSPEIMRSAAALGAGFINDVRGLTRPGAVEAVAATGLPVCIMHMQGTPTSMQTDPQYQDAVADVFNYLSHRKAECVAAGIAAERIVLDPGIGFGKKDPHNLALLRQLQLFSNLGPVLLGVSRKSMFGRLLGRELGERFAGSLATAAFALAKGVKILRVHDVAATIDLVKMFELIERPQEGADKGEL